jgi:thiol-disulfide isomerase/thioredoxin
LTAFLLARLALAVLFAVAAVSKLVDQAGTRKALTGFGLPARSAWPAAVVLPLVEAAIAVALIPTSSATWAAAAALVLLAAFGAAIVSALLKGHQPDCHCFGRLHSAPASWGLVVRNAVLALAAGVVVLQGLVDSPPTLTGWYDDLSSGERVAVLIGLPALVLLGLQAWFSFALLRQNGHLLLRVEDLEGAIGAGATPDREPGLPVGLPAPDFSALNAEGEAATLETSRVPGRLTVLLFADPGCAPCLELLPQVADWQNEHRGRLAISVITTGELEAAQELRDRYGLQRIIVQRDREIAEAYRAYGTPTATLLYSDGRIARPLALGAKQIEALVGEATTRFDTRSAQRNGGLAAAGVAAGASAVAITGTAASPQARGQSSDPEVQALNALIASVEERLNAQAQEAGAKVKKLTKRPFGRKAYRRKVKKARVAIQILVGGLSELRRLTAAMQPSGARGQNAQRAVLEMLDLLVEVEKKVADSLTGSPRQRRRDAKQAYENFGESIQKGIDASFLLQQ